jgi:hypothetical protein
MNSAKPPASQLLAATLCAFVSGCATPLPAARHVIPTDVNEAIIVRGFIRPSASKELIEAIRSRPAPQHVIFDDCRGGVLDASVALAEAIRAQGAITSAGGYVASGCAFAYLAGVERRQLRGKTLLLDFHSPSRNGQALAKEVNERLLDQAGEMTNGKFPGEWRTRIANRIGTAGVQFLSMHRENGTFERVTVCDDFPAEPADFEKACTSWEPVSFIELGLVTHN